MRQILQAIALVLMLATPAAAQFAAVVVGLEGTVEVLKAGSQAWTPAVPNQGLAPGDRIRVGSGKATLLGPRGKPRVLGNGSEATIESPTASPRGGGALDRLWQAIRDRATLALDDTALVSKAGAVRLPVLVLDLVSPRNTSLLELPGELVWKPMEGATAYRVLITDSRGRPVVRERVEQPKLALSAFVQRFRPGAAYFVTVSDLRPGGVSSHKVYFRLLPEELRKSVLADVAALDSQLAGQVDPQVAALARGSLYEYWGLLEDALRVYRQAGATPGPVLKQAIGLLHVRNGRRWAIGE
jgi:hypothetical protein